MSKWPSNYLAVDQHSPEWYQARCGLVTASNVARVLKINKVGQLKGITSAERETYKMEMLTEIVTGTCVEHFVSPAMDFGITNEPLARTAYELNVGVEVERIGFAFHPSVRRSGASPDGLVGDSGLVEIKVPNTKTHLEYVIAGGVPEDYKAQMLWQMACTEREWCDFVSYDPRLHEDFGLFIVRFERDDKAITEMEREVERFIAEVNEMAEKLKGRVRQRDPLPGPPRAEIPTELLGRVR